MSKYVIADIDREVCKGGCSSFSTAMRRVLKHIQSKIDTTFPEAEFMEWLDSGTEKPFKWNKNTYHWS
jgi:hypothetical protein